MLGVGLAAAVLIDATLVRGILLPAALAALGERTWFLPRCLRWVLPDRELTASAPAAELGAAREEAGQLPAAR
jgi:RND superfamily putative drug exporter